MEDMTNRIDKLTRRVYELEELQEAMVAKVEEE